MQTLRNPTQDNLSDIHFLTFGSAGNRIDPKRRIAFDGSAFYCALAGFEVNPEPETLPEFNGYLFCEIVGVACGVECFKPVGRLRSPPDLARLSDAVVWRHIQHE